MILDKDILKRMLDSHWVKDAMDITPTGDKIQVILVPRVAKNENVEEPFPGLNEEIMSLINGGAVKWILGCASDTERKIINMQMTVPESTHTEDRP